MSLPSASEQSRTCLDVIESQTPAQQSDQFIRESPLALTSNDKPFDALGSYAYDTKIKFGKQHRERNNQPFDALGSYKFEPVARARKRRKDNVHKKSKRQCVEKVANQMSNKSNQEFSRSSNLAFNQMSEEEDSWPRSQEIIKISQQEHCSMFMQIENENEQTSLLVKKVQHTEQIQTPDVVLKYSTTMVQIQAIASEKRKFSSNQALANCPTSENIDEYLMHYRNHPD